MRAVIVFLPARSAPGGTAKVADAGPRPPAGAGAAAAPGPRPAGAAGAGVKGAGVSNKPLTQTSPVFRIGPVERMLGAAVSVQSSVRVNHTTPSKSGRPRDSQLPGTSMSFHSLDRSASAGARQSGLIVPRRSETGRPVY